MDAIEPVANGELGADVDVSAGQRRCGAASRHNPLESKRTKAWSDTWLPKLREDQRRCGADIALIVSRRPS